jgi:hypothetical protein
MLHDIKSILHLIVIFQCLFFSFYLLTLKNIKRLSNIILAAFLLSKAISEIGGVFSHFAELREFVISHCPHLLYINIPFHYLYVPMLFLYVLSLTKKQFHIRKNYLFHFFPFIIFCILIVLKFYIHSADRIREILLKVKASGICGTDVMEWYRAKKAPRVLDHETTGDIVDIGEGVKKFNVGQRVFVTHHVPCYECKYCLEGNHTACEVLHKGNYDPGGFSEFIRVPKMNVEHGTFLLPENISYEEGTMIEPLACCVRGQKVINIKENHTVLILGSGVSGLSNIQLAKLRGARVVATDVDNYKLKKAEEFGADEVIDAKQKY